MEPLITISSYTPNSDDFRGNSVSSSDLFLLESPEKGPSNDEAALQHFPILDPDSYGLGSGLAVYTPSTTSDLQPEASHSPETNLTTSRLVVPEAVRLVSRQPKTEIDDTHIAMIDFDPDQMPDKMPSQSVKSSPSLDDAHSTVSIVTTQIIEPGVEDPNETVKAHFIIPHTSESTIGVIEAVYKEMSRVGKYNLELHETPEGSYMRITGLAKNIGEYINVAQDVAQDLISDESVRGSNVFVEPPTQIDSAAQVVLRISPDTGGIRPILQPGQDAAADLQLLETSEQYRTKLNEYLYKSLVKAGRLKLSLALRVYLGHFMLKKHPRGKEVYGYNDFQVMVKNPRAGGWLGNWIGDEALARKILDFVRNSTDGPFRPTGNQANMAADVMPEYALEMRSEGTKFDIPIKKRTTGRRTRGTIACQLYAITSSTLGANPAECNVYNLSPGKNLDWQFEAIDVDKGAKTFPEVNHYLRSAKVELHNSERPHDFDVYPSVKLDPSVTVERKIKYVAVKTIYHFRWESTSYIVEIAVNHRWDSIPAMQAEEVPKTELGIGIFGEEWDFEDDAVGNVWGDELQYLFEAVRGSTAPEGLDRVDHFLRTVGDIRNTLDHLF
ncbi:hypothetical protein F5Y11DRAFT_352945 [Daldinia sp. FL1419]|nr:hypothetical protein F5Y11DRAFT_352945 [Daldinia sp. FL1419]